MFALLTSCNRPDLLERTVKSFYKNQIQKVRLWIHEDGDQENVHSFFNKIKEITDVNGMVTILETEKVGQHKSIEMFLDGLSEKYYIHLEDDWEFNNKYDWISESIKIMNSDPKVIKVLCRDGSPHPCDHRYNIPGSDVDFGYIEPWRDNWEGHLWHGFSFNPGVTRMDLLKKFVPFPSSEQELAKKIYDAGYKTVELSKGVYKHIGDGRSTQR